MRSILLLSSGAAALAGSGILAASSALAAVGSAQAPAICPPAIISGLTAIGSATAAGSSSLAAPWSLSSIGSATAVGSCSPTATSNLATAQPALPVDLEAAIKAAYQADPGIAALAVPLASGSIRGNQDPPFVVFKVSSLSSDISSTSHWSDTRLRFDVVATKSGQAAAIRQAIFAAFAGPDGGSGDSLSFAAGVTTSPVQTDQSDSAPSQRLKNGALQYWATLVLGFFVRSGRP